MCTARSRLNAAPAARQLPRVGPPDCAAADANGPPDAMAADAAQPQKPPVRDGKKNSKSA